VKGEGGGGEGGGSVIAVGPPGQGHYSALTQGDCGAVLHGTVQGDCNTVLIVVLLQYTVLEIQGPTGPSF